VNRVFLDTSTFLWFVFDDARLSHLADSIISSIENQKLLSMASLWEIAIKKQLGKLSLGMSFDDFLATYVTRSDLEVVPIDLQHLITYEALPFHHRDPFDRLIIAQAKSLRAAIITSDNYFEKYEVQILW
jgi:PIN domain nuclease of toxin-antitoxin system